MAAIGAAFGQMPTSSVQDNFRPIHTGHSPAHRCRALQKVRNGQLEQSVFQDQMSARSRALGLIQMPTSWVVRTAGETRPLLLVAAGKESSDAAPVSSHAGQDCGPILSSGLGEPSHPRDRILATREQGKKMCGRHRSEKLQLRTLGPSREGERVPSAVAGGAER